MQNGERISKGSLPVIKNWGESVFATACLQKDHLVLEYQIPTDNSVIDFRVTNTRSGTSRLVEVTSASGIDSRKKRQRQAMQNNGGGVILTRVNLVGINRQLRKHGSG